MTEACSLQDKVDTACYLLQQELRLDEGPSAALLAAAAAHVRRLQRKERERQEQEEEARWREEREVREVREREEQAAAQQPEAGAQQAATGPQDKHLQETAARGPAAGQQQPEGPGQPEGQPSGPGMRGDGAALGLPVARQGPGGTQTQAAPVAAAARNTGQHLAEMQQQQQQQGEQLQGTRDGAAAVEAVAARADHAAQRGTEAGAASATDQRRQRQQLACQACLVLQQRLATELSPAVLRRLPLASGGEAGSAWQALQESAGRLAAAAASACHSVIPAAFPADDQQPAELVAALLAGDAAALECCAAHLAVSCVVAFNVAANAERRGA